MKKSVPPSRAEALGFSHNEDENEGYAVDLLEDWLYGANEVLDWANRIKQREAVDEARASAALLRRMASDQIELIPELLDAAYSGKTWRAILCALYVGLAAGLIQSDPEIYHARRKLREAEPDAAIWREKRERHAEGGRSTRRLPPDEVLEREVSELHQRRPNLKWKRVCELVAQQYGVKDWRAVARKLQGGPADWRARSP